MVLDIIRRSNRRLMIISLIGLALVVAAALLASRYLYNFALGPFPLDKATLLANPNWDGQQKYFVIITGDDIIDTGYQYVSTNTDTGSETIENNYEALFLDDNLLLVKLPNQSEDKQISGSLVAVPNDEQVQVIQPFEQEYPRIKGQFLPVMLDAGNFRLPGFIGIPIGVLVALLSLLGLSRALGRNGDPLKHPIMRSLARFGDPQTVADQIDMEMQGEHPTLNNTHFTRTWLIQQGPLSFNATRLEDVVWLYKKVTQHRTNGIPTGKSYAALIWDRYGKCITISANEQNVEKILGAAYNRSPWAMAGWSKDLEKQYRKQREALAAQVDQRRQQIAAQQRAS
jgi:hypothetical protein